MQEVLTLQPEKIAKKIRENLLEQKDKLEKYLTILEAETGDIKVQDPDKLTFHIGIEKDIINDLSQLKVILEPLEAMYTTSPLKKDMSLSGLKATIDKLSKDVSEKSLVNRDNLQVVLENLKSNIKTVRSRSGYTNKAYATAGSGMLDING